MLASAYSARPIWAPINRAPISLSSGVLLAMGYLTQRATIRRAVLLAALIVGVPSAVVAQAPWDPPPAGTRFYFSGDPKDPIQIDSSDATSVQLHWGKRALEAVGIFHVRATDVHQRMHVSR